MILGNKNIQCRIGKSDLRNFRRVKRPKGVQPAKVAADGVKADTARKFQDSENSTVRLVIPTKNLI